MTKHARKIGIARTPTDRKVLTEIPFGEGFVAFRAIKRPWSIRYWGIDYLFSFLHLPRNALLAAGFGLALGLAAGPPPIAPGGRRVRFSLWGETLP